MKNRETHEFALYYQDLKSLQPQNSQIIIVDEELAHRIMRVLRLHAGQELVLFDGNEWMRLVFEKEISKKSCMLMLQEQGITTPFKTRIIVYLPLLKRESFETALYSLVEIGVAEIYLVSTAKTQRSFKEDMARITRIMIAAAEQSKNFVMPHVHEPISFEMLVKKHDTNIPSLFFDPAGKPLLEMLSQVAASSPENIVVMVGPEGDLTPDEKTVLKQKNVQLCALTPTILRACQAVAVGVGALRSVLK